MLQTPMTEEVEVVGVEEGQAGPEEGGWFGQKKPPDSVTSFAAGVVRVATSLVQ